MGVVWPGCVCWISGRPHARRRQKGGLQGVDLPCPAPPLSGSLDPPPVTLPPVVVVVPREAKLFGRTRAAEKWPTKIPGHRVRAGAPPSPPLRRRSSRPEDRPRCYGGGDRPQRCQYSAAVEVAAVTVSWRERRTCRSEGQLSGERSCNRPLRKAPLSCCLLIMVMIMVFLIVTSTFLKQCLPHTFLNSRGRGATRQKVA